MHWVIATTPEGAKTFVNLAAILGMARGPEYTVLFLGGVTAIKVVANDPATGLPREMERVEYARTHVKETPEQLLALPEVSRLVQQQAVKNAIVADAARAVAAKASDHTAPAPALSAAAGPAQPVAEAPVPGALNGAHTEAPRAPRNKFRDAKSARARR